MLATDGRYRTQAAEQAPELEIAIERALGRYLVGRAAEGGVGKLGFESNVVTVDGFDALTSELASGQGAHRAGAGRRNGRGAARGQRRRRGGAAAAGL